MMVRTVDKTMQLTCDAGHPLLGVKARDVKADLLVDVEAAVGVEEVDVGRLHGVLGRKVNFSMVDALLEWRVVGAPDGEMPLEEVVVDCAGAHVFGLLGVEFFQLIPYALQIERRRHYNQIN